MIMVLMSLLVGDCSPACGKGLVCINSVCSPPQNQAIAACSCRCGETPTCDQSGDLSGIAPGSSSGSGWGNCRCSHGFQPSLRLVFRWEPADNITYKVPDKTSSDASQMLAISGSGLSDAAVRQTIHDAFNNWNPSACPGGGAPVLHVNNPAADAIPVFQSTQTQSGISFDNNGQLQAPGPYDLENRVWVNNSLGSCDRPCLGTVVAGGDSSCSDGNQCQYGDGVLAFTPVTYASSSSDVLGRIYRARTVVDGKAFKWRTSSGGCANGSANCYDLLNTLTHELGHFFGYQHTSCATSIMYATAGTDASIDGVLEADLASLCGEGNCATLGYPNNLTDPKVAKWVDKTGTLIAIDTSGKARLSTCTLDTDCGTSTGRMKCIGAGHPYPAGAGGVGGTSGFCSVSCASAAAAVSSTPSLAPLTRDADCPAGEACVTFNNGASGSQSYCVVSSRVPACVPQAFSDPSCSGSGSSSGGSATSGLTSGGGGGSGGGTTGLTGSADAPTNGGAFTDFCAPCQGHADCNTGDCVDLGNGQNICTGPCSKDIDCPAGATCSGKGADGGFCYPTDTSCVAAAAASRRQLNEACDQQSLCSPGLLCVQLNNAAVCLEYCDPAGANTCASDGYACVRIDNTHNVGVCFKATAHEGDGCALPDTSLCGLSGKFICAGTAANAYQDAKCYGLCGDTYGNCSDNNQTCVDFDHSTTGVCSPLKVSQCLSDLGQQCAKPEDCSSGICHVQGNLSGCTRSCDFATKSGCPASFDCEDAHTNDGKGLCWPTSNTITKPKCPAVTTGCGCRAGGGLESLAAALAVAMVMLWRRRKS